MSRPIPVSGTAWVIPVAAAVVAWRVAAFLRPSSMIEPTPGYALALGLLGLAFLVVALRFAQRVTRPRARQLFLVSIVYLPVLLGLMALDKLKL